MFEKEAEEYASSATSDRGYYYEGLKEGFLVGLKTGRPEWHDLRENPDDLPKESIPIYALSSNDSINECIYIPNVGFKDPDFSEWYQPVAWIEKEKILPKYMEK